MQPHLQYHPSNSFQATPPQSMQPAGGKLKVEAGKNATLQCIAGHQSSSASQKGVLKYQVYCPKYQMGPTVRPENMDNSDS